MRIFVVVAVLAFAPIPMAYQNQPSATPQRKNAEQANPPAPTYVNCNCTAQTDDSKNKSQGWHKFVAWPEGIATLALILTLGAIVWQACETRRSVNIAAQTLIAMRRPKLQVKWVFVIPDKSITSRPEDGNDWKVGCLIANVGESTAHIVESDLTIPDLGIGSLQSIITPDSIPRYANKHSFGTFSIDPGVRQEITVTLDANSQEWMRLRLGHVLGKRWMQRTSAVPDSSPVICIGFFRYKDESGVARVTGFGWEWNKLDMSFARLNHPNYEYQD